MGFELHVNPAGIEQLMDGPVKAHMDDLAAKVLQAAVDGAPVDTGQMAASLGVETKLEGAGTAAKVVVKIGVRADADARSGDASTNQYVAIINEFGDTNVPASHFMSQAMGAAR